jgi:hypothetical protein
VLTIARVLVSTTIVAALGCKPTFRDCAVHCGINDLCPTDTRCGTDGFCHTPGTVEEACAVVTDGAPGPDAFAQCTPPLLLVALQDLMNGTGQIRRFSIGSDGVTRCSGDLPGKGTLDADVMALAWVPPQSVAIVTQTQIHLVDVQTDRVAWSIPVQSQQLGLPVDATVIGTTTPTLLVGLDSKLNSSPDARFVDTHRLDSGAFIASSTLAFDPERIARDPADPSRILTLKTGMFAAAETDPVSGMRLDPPFVRDVTDVDLKTIRALFGPPTFVAWVGSPTGNRDGIYYFRDGLSNAGGPIRCDATDRSYVDAVPDPDRSHFRFFAISDSASGREVVHFATTGGPCDPIVVGSMLGASLRIAAIGVIDS